MEILEGGKERGNGIIKLHTHNKQAKCNQTNKNNTQMQS